MFQRVSNDPCPVSTTSTSDETKRLSTKEMSKSRITELDSNPVKKIKTEVVDLDDDDIEIIDCIPVEKNVLSIKTEVSTEQNLVENCSNDKIQFVNSSTSVPRNLNETGKSQAPKVSSVTPDIIDLSDESDDDNKKSEEVGSCLKEVLNNFKEEPMQVDENSLNNNIPECNIEQPKSDEFCEPVAVKDEPNFNFSQIDLVELDGDEENFFPASQLFDKSVVKSEEENDEERGFSLRYEEEDDERNVITILDSDDDDYINNLVDPLHLSPKKEPPCTDQDDPLDLPKTVNFNVSIDPPLQNEISEDDPENPNHQFYYNIPNQSNGETDSFTSINIEETIKSIENQRELLSRKNQDLLLEASKNRNLNQSVEKDKQKNEISSLTGCDNDKMNKLFETEASSSKLSAQIDNGNDQTESVIEDEESSTNVDLSNKSTEIRKKHHSSKEKHSDRKKDGSKTNKSKTKSIQIVEPHHMHKKKSKSKEKKSKSDEKSKKKKRNRDDSSPEKISKDLSTNEKDESKEETKNSSEQKRNDDNNAAPMQNFSLSNEVESMRPRCKTTMVKVKVSKKSRGDMLCETMQSLRPKPRHKKPDVEATKKTEAPKVDTLPGNMSSFIIPRRQVPSSSLSNQSHLTNHTTNIPSASTSTVDFPWSSNVSSTTPHSMNFYGSKSPELPDVTNHAESIPLSVSSSATNDLNLSPCSSDSNDRPPSPCPDSAMEFSNNITNLKPVLAMSSLIKPNQKRVSFKKDIFTVREFQIPEGNNLRNIKDGLSLRSTKKDFHVPKILDLKIEDFLARTFAWEPVWLEQQQRAKSLPPIVKMEELQKLPNTFKNFPEYYKRMETLLLLETWQYLVKEYECNGTR